MNGRASEPGGDPCELLSVVVPFLNNALTLERCLSSVEELAQSGARVILIDNGSEDGSRLLAQEWASRVGALVIDETQRGVSAARNRGLTVVGTPYLTFVDADDWIVPAVLHELLEETIKSSADVGRCSMRVVDANTSGPATVDVVEVGTSRGQGTLIDPSTGVHGVVYRTALLRNAAIVFPAGPIGEDLAFNFAVMCQEPVTLEVPAAGYVYLVGASHSLTSRRYSVQELVSTLLSVCPKEEVAPHLRRGYSRMVVRAVIGAVRRDPAQGWAAARALKRVANQMPKGRVEVVRSALWYLFEYRASLPAGLASLMNRRTAYISTGR